MNKDLTVEIHANTKQAIEDINKLKEEIKHFSKNVDTSNEILAHQKKSLEGVADKVKSLALAYGGFEVVKGVISTVADFEQSITRLGAISNASTSELNSLKDKARELGENTRYSASQVAEAMNYEAMSGMKTNEILKSTKDILNLANVGQLDLAKASDIATDSMSAFGLKAEDIGHITDVMASTITNSNTNVEQLGEAFKNVAPVAKNLGLTIGETSGMLGVLANAGKKGGEAGTHLKIILQRLASTAKPVVKGLNEIGVKAYDSNGKLKPLTSTLHAIQGKLKDLSEQKRNAILKDLFGEEAISSANIILGNLSDMDKLIKKVSNSDGQASDMSKKFNDTMEAQWATLKSALQELALTIGDDLLPALKSITEELISTTRGVTEFYKENKALIKTVTELIGVIYGLGKVKAVIEGIIGLEALAGITSFKGGIVALRVALSALALEAAPIVALGVAIGGVLYYLNGLEESIGKLNDSTKMLNKNTNDTKEIFDKVNSSYSKATNTFNMTKKAYDSFSQSIATQIENIDKSIDATKKASDGSRQYKEQLSQLDRQKKVLLSTYKKVTKNLKIVKDTRDKSTDSVKKAIGVGKKLADKTKEYSKEELDTIKKTYISRLKSHEKTVQQLLNKEITLKNKIVELNNNLAKKLKSIDNERIASKEDLQSKIHDLSIVGLSDEEKYNDKKLQADKTLSKAKIALKNGELSEYKRYKRIYEGLVTSIAKTEIKKGKDVLVSKKESAKYGINSLKELSSLDNDYYDQKKSNAIKLHNEKIAQIEAELQATKAQLELEMQRIQLEKQLIQEVTGKKVDIDVSGAKKSIKSLDSQINALSVQIKRPKSIKVDNSQAISSVNSVKSAVVTLHGKTIKVNADTTPADFGINSLITTHKDSHVDIKVNPKYEEAQKKIDSAIRGFEKRKVITTVDANTRNAQSKGSSLKSELKRPTTFKINADARRAESTIRKVQRAIHTTLTIRINARHALSVIRQLQKNTSSTHTVYVRQVQTHANGGFIRRTGQLQGHDLNGSDDVPAMLTQGEFIQNVRAVDYYGSDFMERLNRLEVPKVQKYALGGFVTHSSNYSIPTSQTNLFSNSGKTVNLNLNIGDKQYKMISDEEVANALANHLSKVEL